MSKKDETEKPKDGGCLSALSIFVRNCILFMLGSMLGNFLFTQCREPQWSDYMEHLERQENHD